MEIIGSACLWELSCFRAACNSAGMTGPTLAATPLALPRVNGARIPSRGNHELDNSPLAHPVGR